MINVCPAALVEAAPGHVWRVLTEQYEAWSGAELVRAAPAGPAAPGQVIEFRARALGRAWPVVMRILEADAASPRLRVDVRLPLGIVNHETVTISPAGDGRSLVRFN